VEFTIDEVSMKYIDQNSIASVGNDGLLGNKIINISPIGIPSQPVQEGSVLKSTNPVEMEHIMRTLMDSNNNLKSITDNLKDVSFKLNSDNSLWRLVNDEQMANNVRFSASNLNRMSNQALSITGDLLSISKGIKQGKGSIGKLINDTMLVTRINNTMGKFERISDTVTMMSKDMAHVVTRIKQGEGTVGKLLKDTLIVYNLNRTLISVDTGISRFNENMKAVQYSWPFKKYYKKIKPKQ
jgi:phospholipid/cholesterol/gamma-HCH transport system substrate-binding protein